MGSSTLVAMLLADGRLPTGGHAYSAGLEPAMMSGLPASQVPEFLRTRATTSSRVEAGTAVAARHAVLTGADIRAVDVAWAARTPAPAVREASIAQARGYLRLALRLWPAASSLVQMRAASWSPCRPVVVGAIAAEAGLCADELVRVVIYDEAATAAGALLKLDPRDPAETTTWILDTCEYAEPQVASLAAITEPAGIPGAGTPQSEEWAQRHSLATHRLFRA